MALPIFKWICLQIFNKYAFHVHINAARKQKKNKKKRKKERRKGGERPKRSNAAVDSLQVNFFN